MLQNIVFVILGLLGLYFGGDWLVNGASRVAKRLRISPLIIGLTIVAIGTSAPELFVSVIAATEGSEGLALGNVIGSNIANIGLILGLTGVVTVVHIKATLVRREIPILFIVTFFATLLILDGKLSRLDGLLLLAGFVAFNMLFYYLATHNPEAEAEILSDLEVEDAEGEEINLLLAFGYIIAGSVILIIGARLMVTGSIEIARAIGLSEVVIGVTMVAFGTSLPELATSMTAAFKGEDDIAVGNIIGSNVANLLLVLGTTSTIATIDVANDTQLSAVEYIVMLSFTLLLLPFFRNQELSRIESAVLLGGYFAFIGYSFFLSGGV